MNPTNVARVGYGYPTSLRNHEDHAMKDSVPAFASLSKILRKHSGGLSIKTDEPGNFYVERPAATPKSKPEFFGAVQQKKSYVSYHLMPLYEDPTLLDGISDALLKRMQGKSCFNFKADEPTLFKELDALTKKCAAVAKPRSSGT